LDNHLEDAVRKHSGAAADRTEALEQVGRQ